MDDVIIYMTVHHAPYGSKDPQWFLVAILQVMEQHKSHEAAAAWYTERGLALPKNCIVDGNDAVGWQKTSQSVMVQNPKSKGKISVRRIEQDFDKWSDIEKVRYWDAEYKKRFDALDSGGDYKNRSFVVCKSLYMNLDSPQIITEKVCQAVWRKPKPKLTQTAVKLTKSEFQEMLAKMAIFIEAL